MDGHLSLYRASLCLEVNFIYAKLTYMQMHQMMRRWDEVRFNDEKILMSKKLPIPKWNVCFIKWRLKIKPLNILQLEHKLISNLSDTVIAQREQKLLCN